MTYVTYGGVTVGLLLLAWHLATWWPGIKALRSNPAGNAAELLPFLLAWSYGVLTILGIGGLIGWAARTTLWSPTGWGTWPSSGALAGSPASTQALRCTSRSRRLAGASSSSSPR